MKIFIEKENKTVEEPVPENCTALLAKLNILPTTVIIVKNNKVVLPDEKLSESDDVKILSVVSGG